MLIDEPEGHLHPPLLSAFVRALSELLVNRNGVAIIATHSPVVLQEVPRLRMGAQPLATPRAPTGPSLRLLAKTLEFSPARCSDWRLFRRAFTA